MNSHLMIKSRKTATNQMEFYTALLQVDSKTKSIIIDLDESAYQKEVKVLYNTDKCSDPEYFINAGFNFPGGEVNASKTLILKDEKYYDRYTFIDLMVFKAIQEALESDSNKLPEIPRKTLLCTVEGQTIFSFFFKEIRVYEQITKQL